MVYFYCCDVVAKGKKTMRFSGSLELNGRISTIKQLEEVQEEIRCELFKQKLQRTNWHLEDIELNFNAFNPL